MMIKFVRRIKKSLATNFKFVREYKDLKREDDGRFRLCWEDKFPCLGDNTSTTYFDRHYIYHPAWAMRVLQKTKPKVHFDISSSLYFSTLLSAFLPVKFYDYRPAKIELSNLECLSADLVNLPFESSSIMSISCMHTIEHIGLGRYGDPIDYNGDLKAMKELARVLAPGGDLLLVVPVAGESVIKFNAHRIYNPLDFINKLQGFGLCLKEFTLIPDSEADGNLVRTPPLELINKQKYGCGCFWFTKNEQ